MVVTLRRRHGRFNGTADKNMHERVKAMRKFTKGDYATFHGDPVGRVTGYVESRGRVVMSNGNDYDALELVRTPAPAPNP